MKKVLILLFGMVALGCAPRELTLTRSRLLMGHVPVNLSLHYSNSQKDQALAASEGAFQLAQATEAKISEWQPSSELSCLNQNAGKAPCPLSETTRDLLEASLKLSEATDHAFDIRFASKSASGRRGALRIEHQASRGFLVHPETRLGVGAIGKGWIVDRMLEYLRGRGFISAIVDAGGDVYAMGGPWQVAIQIPEGAPDHISAVREIRDRALATSGLYEQGPHILDPATGRPVLRRGSVTVEAGTLTQADALATAFFVMGEEKSQNYLSRFPGVRMIWMDPNGNSRSYPDAVSGMKDKIQPVK